MRNPNGYGTITKLKQKLRNPYRVRVIAERDPETRLATKYKTLGYYKTYAEARQALAAFNVKPRLYGSMTLEDLYNEVFPAYFEERGLAIPTRRTYLLGWSKIPLKQYRLSDIRPSHIRQSLLDPDLKPTIPTAMMIVYHALFDYAVAEQYIDTNVARQVVMPKAVRNKINDNKSVKTAFTDEEIAKIYSMVGQNEAAAILWYTFHSGWRPSEVLNLTADSVNFQMNFVNGGSKTDAGKNRAVPIHPDIKDFLRSRVKNGRLFSIQTYAFYRRHFNELMFALGIEGHTPHDARRTFVTLAKAAGMDEYALKRIVGHTIRDLTESVYTDRPRSWLYEEMCKVKVYKAPQATESAI